MGCDLKNARSASKIIKWPSLRPPALKSLYRGLVQKMLLERKALLSNNVFHTNILIVSKQLVL